MKRIAAFAALGVLLAAPVAAQDWTSYTSRQFGLKIAYPEHLVDAAASRPQDGEYALANDGQLVLSLDEIDGAGLRGFLDRNLLRGVDVTYTRRKGDWMAYSGYVDDYIVYGRTQLSCGGRYAHTFLIRYPRTQRATYDPAVRRLSHSLRVDPAFEARSC